MISRRCPVCDSNDATRVFAESNVDVARLDAFAFASRKVPEYMHHRLIECPGCDLLYASPVPSRETLAQAYKAAAFDSGAEARYAARTYGRLLPDLCRELPDREAALDVGTGDGAFLQELLAAGFGDVAGVEPSSAPIAAAPPTLRPLIRQAIFWPESFEARRFSLITCFQTMEHLDDPLTLFRGALRLLKPGGALFLIGHNRRAASARLLGMKSPIYDLEHLQLFSETSARRMMSEAGYERVRVRPLVNRYPLHYWIKLLPLPINAKRGLMRTAKAAWVGHVPIPLPAGNMAVIGFRPQLPPAQRIAA
jgi:SAM-dependent methyltransferase